MALSTEAEDVWRGLLVQIAQARWDKCLREVRSRIRPRREEIRDKWYFLYRRLLARKRWTTVLRRVRRMVRRFITERRSNAITKWCSLTQHLLERQKAQKTRLSQEKERKRTEYLDIEGEQNVRKETKKIRPRDMERGEGMAKFEKQDTKDEERGIREGKDDGDQGNTYDEEERQPLETSNTDQIDTGVEQRVFRTGSGFSEMSDTADPDLGSVLFDARPSTESLENALSEKWIKNFIKFRKDILPGKFDDNTMERIRLTIIDTGIDESHPYIKKRWRRCRTGTEMPLFKDFDSAVDSPVDEDGHGTFIAGLLLRLVPDVEISVARVCRNQASMNKDHERERKLAEAISHAVENWETDIISVSIGYDYDNTTEIRTAISNVVQTNRIVMFCAAGNFRNTRANISLPARADGMFKIFACDHTGWAGKMNPQPSSNTDYCFSILGCNIESTWPMALKEEGENTGLRITEKPKNGGLWTTMSGTSFATPIAAALVAITYQFHDENTDIMNLKPGILMKKPETVKAVLLRMSLPPGTNGYNTLMPTIGRRNQFKFYPGRGKPITSFFADKLSDITWEDF